MAFTLFSNKKSWILTAAVAIIFLSSIWASIRNIEIKRDFANVQTVSLNYQHEYLIKLAKKQNAEAAIIHNSHTGLWDTGDKKQPKLFLELTVGGHTVDDPQYNFHNTGQLRVAPNGYFYLYDNAKHEIRTYNADGKFLFSFGKYGGGPGEFRNVIYFVIKNNQIIYTYDYGNQRLSQFDLGGKFLTSLHLPLEKPAMGFVVDDSGYFYFSYYEQTTKTLIHKFSQKGEYVQSFGYPISFSLPNTHILRTIEMNNYPGPIYIDGETLYFSQRNPYKIDVFSLFGRLKTQITRSNDFLLPPFVKINDKNSYTFFAYAGSSCLGVWKSNLINAIFIPENISDSPVTYFDIFDKKGNLLTSIELEQTINVLEITPEGKIYGKAKDEHGFEQIVRYKITF